MKNYAWYHRPASFVVAFLVVGPFALPLVWSNPHYSRKKKFWITAAALAVTGLLLVGGAWAMKIILDYYRLML